MGQSLPLRASDRLLRAIFCLTPPAFAAMQEVLIETG
jgi:hypothetical protein